MELNKLGQENYKKKTRKRVGRGIGSGKGKTCGSGHKGQKSRSGVAINGFEGGQNPIYMRLPKRGFVPLNKTYFQIVKLSDLQALLDNKKIKASEEVTESKLAELNIVKSGKPVKILSGGEVKSAINVNVTAISKTAKDAIEKAGGKVA